MKNSYDYSVSLIRVISMIFIVVCHIASFFGMSFLSQFFNVGVPIFFFISGYLYGGRDVSKRRHWLFDRYLRLEVPAVLWMAVACIFALFGINRLPHIHETVFLLMDLQGLHFIFSDMQDLFMGPWFLTYMMFCYIVYYLYCAAHSKHPDLDLASNRVVALVLVLCILLTLLGIDLYGLLFFFFGAQLKSRGGMERLIEKGLLTSVLLFVLAVGARLGGKLLFDDTIIYDRCLSHISKLLLATSIIVAIKWAYVHSKMVRSVARSKLWAAFDAMSVYVYVTHQFFILADYYPMFQTDLPFVVQLGLFTAIVICVSALLHKVGQLLTSLVSSAVAYAFY